MAAPVADFVIANLHQVPHLSATFPLFLDNFIAPSKLCSALVKGFGPITIVLCELKPESHGAGLTQQSVAGN